MDADNPLGKLANRADSDPQRVVGRPFADGGVIVSEVPCLVRNPPPVQGFRITAADVAPVGHHRAVHHTTSAAEPWLLMGQSCLAVARS
jgi:hypothetical protein